MDGLILWCYMASRPQWVNEPILQSSKWKSTFSKTEICEAKKWTHSKRKGLWHDDIIKWKHFPHYWPFVQGIHRSPVNSQWCWALINSQWCWALIFSLINGWVNNHEADDLRCHRAHYDVTVMDRHFLSWESLRPVHIFYRQHIWIYFFKNKTIVFWVRNITMF